jgi:murein DD-endopeptidase MepM/ murein hydrolase activator NlpD
LFAVGRRYGVTPQAVAELNGLTFGSTLRVGQRLRLPAAAVDRGPQAAFPGRALAAAPSPVRAPEPEPEPAPPVVQPRIARPAPLPAPPVTTPAPRALASAAQAVVPPPAAEPEAVSTAPAPAPAAVPTPAPLPAMTPPVVTPRPAPAPARAAATASPAVDALAAGRGRFVWPVRGQVLSGFGPRGPGQRNDGLNIAAPVGESVRAAATGEVVYAGDQVPGFGKLVLLKHADGWVTAYAHLSDIGVKMRERVTQGQEIGKSGQTGSVTQPQLHFEVRHAPSPQDRARPVDPLPLLPPQ